LDFIFKKLSIRQNNSTNRQNKLSRPRYANPARFEPSADDEDENSGIRVRQLRKTFNGGSIVALSELDVDVCCRASSASLC
jgi:hypothetical protein